MKISIIFVTLLIGLKQTAGYEIDFVDRIKVLLKQKCLKITDGPSDAEVMKAIDDIQSNLFLDITLTQKLSQDERITKCQENSNNIIQKLKNFGEIIKPCLAPEEIYLTQFTVDVYNTSIKEYCEFICTLNDIIIMESAKRILQFIMFPEKNPSKVCYLKSDIIGDNPTVDIIRKTDLCVDLFHMDSCYATLLDEQFSESNELNRFQRGLLIAASQNCISVLVHGTTETEEDATVTTEATK